MNLLVMIKVCLLVVLAVIWIVFYGLCCVVVAMRGVMNALLKAFKAIEGYYYYWLNKQ